jgi:GTP-binding protein
VVTLGDARRGLGKSFVIADIPGLIPGASQGLGLGIRFLRHLDRTRLLLHLICISEEPGRSPIADYHALRHELSTFDEGLARRPEIVAMTQADRPEVQEAYELAKPDFAAIGIELRLVSAASHAGLDDLMSELFERLSTDA